MRDFVKEALTRRAGPNSSRGRARFEPEPNPKLVLLVQFALAMMGVLSTLQVAHLLILHSWNSEVFAGISGLIGTVTGVLIGRHV